MTEEFLNPRPARVMLVDDDPGCVRGIAPLLELRGLCVVGFDSAQAASEAIEAGADVFVPKGAPMSVCDEAERMLGRR